MKYLKTILAVVVASLALAFPGVSQADDIVTFDVSGNFSPAYSWYFDPSSTVTIDTTTGTITDSYLAVDNTPNGSAGTPFTGAPTNVLTYLGSCAPGDPITCWSQYTAEWVIGNNEVELTGKQPRATGSPIQQCQSSASLAGRLAMLTLTLDTRI